jgi:hypothetical protein
VPAITRARRSTSSSQRFAGPDAIGYRRRSRTEDFLDRGHALSAVQKSRSHEHLMEFKCVPFTEELLYGEFFKRSGDEERKMRSRFLFSIALPLALAFAARPRTRSRRARPGVARSQGTWSIATLHAAAAAGRAQGQGVLHAGRGQGVRA